VEYICARVGALVSVSVTLREVRVRA
jgi:hypothetical protein